jgi:superfamily II DNA or RNA helicase
MGNKKETTLNKSTDLVTTPTKSSFHYIQMIGRGNRPTRPYQVETVDTYIEKTESGIEITQIYTKKKIQHIPC